MSIYGKLMKTARAAKHKLTAINAKPVYISPVRRIGHVATKQRVCAMTFDDGPCLMPPSEKPGGDALTLELLRTLEEYNAFGTFDVVGDTSCNYPDKAGRSGTAAWGGIKYDHYPDIGQDSLGGAAHTQDIVRRIINGGHAITNHGFAHILFGRKNLVYEGRAYSQNIDEVINDLRRLHELILEQHGYEMKFARPAHYVDSIPDGFNSYDAYAAMGYTYMAADFDGAGWLPLSTYKDEVDAMVLPIKHALEANPDSLCGQLIFQKDGFNMARRTPVADGLPQQLELLAKYGYKVVTVPDLLEMSPFSDVGEDDPCGISARALLGSDISPAYRDNSLHPQSICTGGELYMMLSGKEAVLSRVKGKKPIARHEHPYAAAAALCGVNDPSNAQLDSPLTAAELDRCCIERFGASSGLSGNALPRYDVIAALSNC
ncbi:MAG: polysaccharide deacetylase family protein [Oscillospiraceae bacterium]|nr:polysaccharide deacetylase family protein [Oscillospiraceae bacterium]MCL2125398.1 polysaccharide deacetylase family protein [Oscillospiraceae bacterium]